MYLVQIRRRIALDARRPALLFALVFAIVIALDQTTKWAVREAFHPGQSIPLIPNVLLLTHVRNEGAAFGLMPGFTPIFITTSLLVILGIGAFVVLRRPRAGWLVISLSLTSSGALGNLIDRSLHGGRVTDFIDPRVFPVFNVADIAIVCGVAMLAAWILLEDLDRPDESPHAAAMTDASESEIEGLHDSPGDAEGSDFIMQPGGESR